MGKLIVTENITVDGVVEDPTGDQGFRHGGWANQITDTDRAGWASFLLDQALSAEAQLLGRRSYEYFAGRFPSRTGAWADRLNTMPKYVISSTLTDPAWDNTTIMAGDLVEQVTNLKRTLKGDILVYASAQLVPTLLNHDLVDELQLIIYPCALGAGHRLLTNISETGPMRLCDVKTLGDNLTLLAYELNRADAR